MPIADAIQLAISLQSPAVDAQGFGTPLVLTTAGTLTLNTPSFYTTPQALLDDAGAGIINTDDVYKALVDMFSQPNVSKVAVARIDALVAQETKATITAASGAGTATWTATMVVQGLSYVANYTEDGTPTVTEIRDGLKAALEAITVPGGIPATIANDGVDAMDITASSAGWEFSLEITNDGDGTATVANTTPAVTVAGGAGAVFGVDPVGWYGISFAGASDLQVADLAVWAETVRKMHGATATGAGNKTAAADSLFVKLAAQSFVRTVALYNDSGDYAGEAWLANRLAVNPDQRSTIWAFVTLPSVTIGNETTTEQTAIEGTNSNYYAEMGGIGATYPGRTPGNQPPDLITTSDWLFFRLQERYQAIFLDYSNRGSKVPFTDAGIAVFEAATAAQLQLGETIGHFVPGTSVVTVPALEDVSPADRTARTLRFTFNTQPAGAIEKVVISGSIAIPLS